MSSEYPKADAYVIGAGPNGLAAAITLAQSGLDVVVLERNDTPGGGARTAELIRPGYRHDVCSAIHPTAYSSPYFMSLGLEKYGLEWIQPDIPCVHPLDGGDGVSLHRELGDTVRQLDDDGRKYKRLFEPFSKNWYALTRDILTPLGWPNNPFLMAKFGVRGLQPVSRFVKQFSTEKAKALVGGMAAHSILPFEEPGTTAFGLVLACSGHGVGWPFPKGGTDQLIVAMIKLLETHGGQVITNAEITNIDALPETSIVIHDTAPKSFVEYAGHRLSPGSKRALENFEYGAAAYKVDFILSEPVPWAYEEAKKAGTLHLGGSFAEMRQAEREVHEGIMPDKPFVLVAQQSRFDRSRTQGTDEVLWSYAHAPNGYTGDATETLIGQIERFAPGFRDTIIDKHVIGPMNLQEYNPNYVGGDINSGKQHLPQLFKRPLSWSRPYQAPLDGHYFCSSSTPPGGGVHGMSGHLAAKVALKQKFGIRVT